MKNKTINITSKMVIKDVNDNIIEFKADKLSFNLELLLKSFYPSANNLKKKNEVVYKQIILNYIKDNNLKSDIEKIMWVDVILNILDMPSADMKDYLENDKFNNLLVTDTELLFIKMPVMI